jgi:thiosulfate reductase cytochrome b subunit
MSDDAVKPKRVLVPRHALAVRITHWINVVAFTLLLMSGLQIFNAHAALYWGQKSDFDRPWLAMKAEPAPGGAMTGHTVLFGHKVETTGFLGASRNKGTWERRGFPAWATIPSWKSLTDGRLWHFFFAWVLVVNGIVYLAAGAAKRHFTGDLGVTGKDLKSIPHEIAQHARLRFPKGEEARRYNVLQKLTYLSVIFVLFPVLILGGMAMSPGLDAAFDLPSLFGGRQTARSIHFLAALGLVIFVAVHLVMVVLSGTWNNIRSMITGRYAIEVEADHD